MCHCVCRMLKTRRSKRPALVLTAITSEPAIIINKGEKKAKRPETPECNALVKCSYAVCEAHHQPIEMEPCEQCKHGELYCPEHINGTLNGAKCDYHALAHIEEEEEYVPETPRTETFLLLPDEDEAVVPETQLTQSPPPLSPPSTFDAYYDGSQCTACNDVSFELVECDKCDGHKQYCHLHIFTVAVSYDYEVSHCCLNHSRYCDGCHAIVSVDDYDITIQKCVSCIEREASGNRIVTLSSPPAPLQTLTSLSAPTSSGVILAA